MQPRDKFMFHQAAVFKAELVRQQQLSRLYSCNCSCKSFWGVVRLPRQHRDMHLHGR